MQVAPPAPSLTAAATSFASINGTRPISSPVEGSIEMSIARLYSRTEFAVLTDGVIIASNMPVRYNANRNLWLLTVTMRLQGEFV